MKLSLYTFVRNGLYYDFHVVDMLRHHLPLADEIVVNEGYSTDGTYEAIRDLDPKITVFRTKWDESEPGQWYARFKNAARERCTGDWCVLLDCDEFIPEWEFGPLREHLAATEASVVPMRYDHFYGNYQVVHADPAMMGWPVTKRPIHRNRPDLAVWGDGSNVGFTTGDRDREVDGRTFDCHHFGFVRNPARLRQKWRTYAKLHPADGSRPRWDRTPGFVFDLMPHRWDDPDLLPHVRPYDGPYVKAVRDNPDEFVRDDLLLCRLLGERHGRPAEAGRR